MRAFSSLASVLLAFILVSPIYAQDVDVGGTVDKENPTVLITNPINGSTVSGTINVTANASDDVGVSKVEFYVDGDLVVTDTSAPYGFGLDTKTFSNGSHTLLAKVYDTVSKTATDSVTFKTANKVTLESPTKRIQEPTIGPPKVATKSTGEGRKTTLVQIPEEEKEGGPSNNQRDFILGLIIGVEIFSVLLLIYLLRRRKT
ncbi:MAG: Ig-like domain-containing protein [Candidatus Woykebacteria bacterium]